MSKARLVITAVVVEKRPVREVSAAYGVSRSWIYELVARYRAEGDAAFEPRSRRRLTDPDATPDSTVNLIVQLRRELGAQGLDNGADTIGWHLHEHHRIDISRATIYRILKRHGLIEPAPKKNPRSAYIRFEAEQPNETWQSDVTHHRLTNGVDIEIITWLDDHSRYALSVTAHTVVTGTVVVDTFTTTIEHHGTPASTLTDNGLVYTTRFAHGGNTSRNGFENLLHQLGIRQKNSRPNHPTTCGKVERFQQTLKKWLRSRPADTIDQMQHHIDAFVDHYNHHRPHRSLDRRTPAAVYTTRPKATPDHRTDTEQRVRHDRIHNGRVTLRHNGRLHHIGIGRTLDGTRVILLINGLDIRIIRHTTGEILHTLTLDPTRDYQPTGKPPGGPKGPRKIRRSEPK